MFIHCDFSHVFCFYVNSWQSQLYGPKAIEQHRPGPRCDMKQLLLYFFKYTPNIIWSRGRTY